MLDADSFAWIRARLSAAPARVLEVGAGTGELARELRRLGYQVRAIDPAGEQDGVEQTALADLDAADACFDAAVAVLSLHHVEPLGGSLVRLAAVLKPGATLVVDEFDSAAFDRRAAAWLADQWRDEGGEQVDDVDGLVTEIRGHLHPVASIRERLDEWFELGEAERVPYLHRWHLEPGRSEAESRLIAAGELPATGARFTGIRG